MVRKPAAVTLGTCVRGAVGSQYAGARQGRMSADESRRDFLKKVAGAAGAAGAAGLVAAAPAGLSGLAALGSYLVREDGGFGPSEALAWPGKFEAGYLKLERTGVLKRREAELWKMMEKCKLCPRECEVDRLKGEKGACNSDHRVKVSSAFAHFGEEKPLVGSDGSGTVFFSNCNLLCAFCQNWKIAHRGDGMYISHRRLARLMMGLQRRGCHNINLVTPTPNVPHIIKALRLAIPMGLKLPLVYNTGGYDHVNVLKLMDGIVDLYLPDYKYMDDRMGWKYSSRAHDYATVAGEGIKEMHRQTGYLRTDKRGIALRGLMIRHLVMPNNIAGTDRFVRWVAKDISRYTYLNLMPQYRPEHWAFNFPEISRRLTVREMQQAISWASKAGLKRFEV